MPWSCVFQRKLSSRWWGNPGFALSFSCLGTSHWNEEILDSHWVSHAWGHYTEMLHRRDKSSSEIFMRREATLGTLHWNAASPWQKFLWDLHGVGSSAGDTTLKCRIAVTEVTVRFSWGRKQRWRRYIEIPWGNPGFALSFAPKHWIYKTVDFDANFLDVDLQIGDVNP